MPPKLPARWYMLAQLLAARMGMTHGVTGWPVSLAHSARRPQNAASKQATINKLKKNATPTINSTMRTVQRVSEFRKSFKAMPFKCGQRPEALAVEA